MTPRAGLGLALALSALPLLHVVAAILRHEVDVPFGDEWTLAPLIEKSYTGQLGLADLAAPHNEHRLLLPRALLVGLARLSGWDVTWALLAGVAIAALSAGLLAREAARTAGTSWVAPAVALLALSLGQYENWIWGWQVQLFLAALFTVAAVLLAARAQGSWARTAGAGAACLAATLSFGNGLATWPCALLALWVGRADGDRAWRGKAAALGGAGLLTIALYLAGWAGGPAGAPRPSVGPLGHAHFVLTFLGSPLAGGFALPNAAPPLSQGVGRWAANVVVPPLLGLAGLAAAAALARAAWRDPARRRDAAPWLALAAFAVASAALCSLGRAGLGQGQALCSRYTTFAVLLWIGVVVGLGVLARADRRWLGGLALVLALAAWGAQAGWGWLALRRAYVEPAAQALVTGGPLATRLEPVPHAALPAYVEILRARRLSVFR